MVRSASEILRDLEIRVARLEGRTSSSPKRTASVVDTLRSLPRSREMVDEFKESMSSFWNGLGSALQGKSETPIKPPGRAIHGENGPTAGFPTSSWSDVSETDLAAGKLLVPVTLRVKMFFRAPKPIGEYVKVNRVRGLRENWGYSVTPDDDKDKAEVVKAVQSFCKKFGVTYSNIDFPAADKKSGVYPSMYGTLTVMFDLSHFL